MTGKIDGFKPIEPKKDFSKTKPAEFTKAEENTGFSGGIDEYIKSQGVTVKDSLNMNLFGLNSPANAKEIVDVEGKKVAEILGKDNVGRSVIKSGESWNTLFIEE
jgi:hypothetical protein